jgi:threonine synthase
MVEKKIIFVGDKTDVCVPTGNFGNILAAYYAGEMGLPVRRLVCASNKNNVLSEFIQTGIYNKKREFYKTSSPSMDILISSNLERFLFAIASNNPQKILRWYEDLSRNGLFKVDDSTRQRLKNTLYGDFATEEETAAIIKKIFEQYRYLIDPHTAVGVKVYESYRKTVTDSVPAFICGTASPYKFNSAVYNALTGDNAITDEFAILQKLKKISGTALPRAVEGLEYLKIRRSRVIEIIKGRDEILQILGVNKGPRLSLKI